MHHNIFKRIESDIFYALHESKAGLALNNIHAVCPSSNFIDGTRKVLHAMIEHGDVITTGKLGLTYRLSEFRHVTCAGSPAERKPTSDIARKLESASTSRAEATDMTLKTDSTPVNKKPSKRARVVAAFNTPMTCVQASKVTGFDPQYLAPEISALCKLGRLTVTGKKSDGRKVFVATGQSLKDKPGTQSNQPATAPPKDNQAANKDCLVRSLYDNVMRSQDAIDEYILSRCDATVLQALRDQRDAAQTAYRAHCTSLGFEADL